MIAYQLISDITVTSATTSVSFTGLNITKDDDYLLVSDVKNNSSSSFNTISLYPNSNTTSTNYYTQTIYTDNTEKNGSRVNSSAFMSLTYVGSKNNLSIGKIKLTNNGYFVFQNNINYQIGGNTTALYTFYGTSTFISTSITSLQLTSSISNGIGIGSRFQLYKLSAQKVADIIVSSPTTSVDITGLAIDKGSEYMLVSDNIGTDTSSYYRYFITINNNSILSNYYTQYIQVAAANKYIERVNSGLCNYCSVGTNSISFVPIKLTNNGYFVWQSNGTSTYGAGSIHMTNEYGTSTFTSTSITSLRLASSITNGIGTGSRFTLYKLK